MIDRFLVFLDKGAPPFNSSEPSLGEKLVIGALEVWHLSNSSNPLEKAVFLILPSTLLITDCLFFYGPRLFGLNLIEPG